MSISRLYVAYVVVGALVLAGCVKPSEPTSSKVKVTKIEAGPDAQKQAQTALIEAKPGEVIEFGEGKFEFNSTLSCDVSDITIRGQGTDKTILSFAGKARAPAARDCRSPARRTCTDRRPGRRRRQG